MDGREKRTFGELLRDFRRQKNLKQLGLAYKLGKQTRSSIDAWERGLYLPETPETVLAIAEALSLSEHETDALLLAARYAPKYGMGDSGTGSVPLSNNVYTRSPLEELKDYLAAAVPAYEVHIYQKLFTPPSTHSPYKFLDAFGIEDAPVFFGRETATKELYSKVLHNRLVVLHAGSGAGKTSLLNAGISPRLIRGGRLPLYIEAYEDPVLALKRLIATALRGPWPKLLKELPLHEFLGLVCASPNRQTREVIIMLDQFEQFFLLHPDREDRYAFIKELGACYDDQSLPLRFVIALRGDYLTKLAEFQRVLTHLKVYNHNYSPEPMTLEEVQAAIVGPLEKLGVSVSYDPALLDSLLTDLMRSNMELPLLQIICTRLYEIRGKDETQITLKTYEALGHVEGVLSQYLNDVLTHLPSNEEALARGVLKALVRSDGMKQILSDKTLAARVEVQRDELDRVLPQLVNARLLRREKVADKILYELAHEYLTTEIVKWVSLADQEFKQAEELLQRELTNWRIHHDPIPKSRLEMLYPYRGRFKGLDPEAWRCLVSSALKEDFAIMDWVEAAGASCAVELLITALKEGKDEGVRRRADRTLGALRDPRAIEPLITALKDEAILVQWSAAEALEGIGDLAVEPLIMALQDEAIVVRRWAAEALERIGGLAIKPLSAALQDEDIEVRRRAAGALGQIRKQSALKLLIMALQDEDTEVRRQAVGALKSIGDLAVEPLIMALQDEDTEVRRQAKGALKSIGNPAIQPLLAASHDEDIEVRRRAKEALNVMMGYDGDE